jgi:YVTN family beta-propeller protein
MQKQVVKGLAVVALSVGMWSCREKDPEPKAYDSGVVVLNGGNFFDNNGSLSFFAREQSVAEGDVFLKENGSPLTGGVQGYAEGGGYGLILVDNSTAGQDKVEIVTAGTFKRVGTLRAPDIENPRSVVVVSGTKAYVSCWDATGDFSDFYKNPGYVAVVDLPTQRVVKRIAAPKGAERLVQVGTEVYVGTSAGTVLTVLDVATDAVKRSITVGTSPNPIALDANGKLWVESGSNVVRLNPASGAVEATLRVGTHPAKTASQFAISPDLRSFYFVYSFFDPADGFKQKGEVYRFSITDASISASQPFVRRVFSGLAVDPMQGLVYAGVTPSFKQAGYVVRYRTDATVVDSVKVEIAPSGFYFK